MTRILVTGASGFIGRPLVAALSERGHRVRAVVRTEAKFDPAVETVVVADLTDRQGMTMLLDAVDVVIHLAGIAHIGRGVPDADYDHINRGMTAALAEAAGAKGISRFLFLSSIRAQSGPSAGHVLTESDQPQPGDAYGKSKLAAEAAIRASGVPHTILRPVLIYGPDVKGNLAALMKLASLPVPLPFAAFTSRRSLLGIENLVGAIMHCLETPQTTGETYIVADPTTLALPDIVAALRRAQHRPPWLFAIPPRWFELACTLTGNTALWERLGGSLEASPAKLVNSGWRPAADTSAGLAAMVQARLARNPGTASPSTR